MRIVINFVKGNPVTIVAVVIALAAVVILVMVNTSSGDFIEQMAARNDQINTIDQLGKQTVTIPPEDPDQPPRVVRNVAINEVAINQLDETYKTMAREYNGISAFTEEVNRRFKGPMLDGLFPTATDLGKQYEAKVAYRNAVAGMLGPYTPGTEEARLNAGAPVNGEEIQTAIDNVRTTFLTTQFFPALKSIAEIKNPEDKRKLEKLEKDAIVNLLKSRAKSIHLYAEADIFNAEFPFTIGAWVRQDGAPTWAQLWEGQMDLWAQQDIARAIALTNQTDNPNANVSNMPIKRLLRIAMQPSGLDLKAGAAQPAAARAPVTTARPADAAPPSADEKLPDNFTRSVTGRQTNVLYDVRHAKVTLIIEAQRIPEFFKALSRVNFITATGVTLKDIDEYEALRQGYLFGSNDCVEMEVELESIWLRNWTTELMPPPVQLALGITKEEEEKPEGSE